MKMRYVLHNWKLYTRERKRLHEIQVRAGTICFCLFISFSLLTTTLDFLYHDKLLVHYFERWRSYIRLTRVARGTFLCLFLFCFCVLLDVPIFFLIFLKKIYLHAGKISNTYEERGACNSSIFWIYLLQGSRYF